MRSRGLVVTAVVAALGLAVSAPLGATPTTRPDAVPGSSPSRAPGPAVAVTVLRSGLDIPWDLGFVGAKSFLLTERAGRLWLGSTSPGAPLRRVSADFSDLVADGEAGLLGLAVDSAFASNRIFYTCQTHRAPDDVRVVRWRLAADGARATRVGAPVVSGIPLGSFHTGCRVVHGPDGKLWVSTGDAGLGPAPQSRFILGGKVLRVGRDGSIPSDNPFFSAGGNARYVWTSGHRNVQGLALRPGTGQMWSAEHGPTRDDEVNLLRRGGNYGWDPVFPNGQPGYNQLVPMTDLAKYPNAIPAKWSSGQPTIATSGMAFLTGRAWGAWRGAAVVAQLKGTGVLTLQLTAGGTVTSASEIAALDGTHGRIRTVRMGPDGALYVLTANGGFGDKVLRVVPVGNRR